MIFFHSAVTAVTLSLALVASPAFATDPDPVDPSWSSFSVGAGAGYEGAGYSSPDLGAHFIKESGAGTSVFLSYTGNACRSPDCGNTTFLVYAGAFENVTGSFQTDLKEGWTGSTANAGAGINIGDQTYSAGGSAAGDTSFAAIGGTSTTSGASYTGVDTVISASGCAGCSDVAVTINATDSRYINHTVTGAGNVYNIGSVSSGASVGTGGNH